MQIRIVITCICIFPAGLPGALAQSRNPDFIDATESPFFETSSQCLACHSNLHTADGQDVSIGYAWRASMMANSARDPYWHAAVRREVTDHPSAQAAIEDKCSTCHMPMARFSAAHTGGQGRVFENIYEPNDAPRTMATDGVSCTVCHQIRSENLGEESSFDGGFDIDDATAPEERRIFGPHDVDTGRQRVMHSAARFTPTESAHLQQSELCATCHTLLTQALNEAGQQVGELAEQVPYLEWLHSDYRTTQSCQSCHMPELTEETAISSVLGQPRPNFSQHVFRGANASMLGILNRHRGELGVQALPQEFAAGIRRTRDFLGSQTAHISIRSPEKSSSRLQFEIEVRSLAGHKLPTAYPSRRVWLHVSVTDNQGDIVFESGAPRADGSIEGNDNDIDAARYEPHYERIEEPDQVQIYEPILAGEDGRVTTGLLTGVAYIKDNRILPAGFSKADADHEIAVLGSAADDADFIGGGDRIIYEITYGDARGPLTVRAELLYQSIGYRWAANLREYRSDETDRFVRYYGESAHESAILISAATSTID